MPRVLWIVAGCLVAYVASGYVQGLFSDENDNAQSEKGGR